MVDVLCPVCCVVNNYTQLLVLILLLPMQLARITTVSYCSVLQQLPSAVSYIDGQLTACKHGTEAIILVPVKYLHVFNVRSLTSG